MEKNRTRLIYVVDDERLIAETLSAILKKNGFSAFAFFDPIKALSAASIEAPDLLISDIMMPHMSGIDLAIALTTICPCCQVLLLSAQAHTSDLLHDARQRAYDFTLLSKPVHPRDLLNTIQSEDWLPTKTPFVPT